MTVTVRSPLDRSFTYQLEIWRGLDQLRGFWCWSIRGNRGRDTRTVKQGHSTGRHSAQADAYLAMNVVGLTTSKRERVIGLGKIIDLEFLEKS